MIQNQKLHWKSAYSTSLQSSGNSYTFIVINKRTFSVSLRVQRNNQGVKTAKNIISAYCAKSEINEKYADITKRQSSSNTYTYIQLAVCELSQVCISKPWLELCRNSESEYPSVQSWSDKMLHVMYFTRFNLYNSFEK